MKRPKSETKYDEISQIVWNEDMGRRLALVRMLLLEDQIDFSHRLCASQTAVSNVERGTTTTLRVTLADLKRALGKHLEFVLFGTTAANYPMATISRRYWTERLQGSRSNAKKRQNWEERMADLREKRASKKDPKPPKRERITP